MITKFLHKALCKAVPLGVSLLGIVLAVIGLSGCKTLRFQPAVGFATSMQTDSTDWAQDEQGRFVVERRKEAKIEDNWAWIQYKGGTILDQHFDSICVAIVGDSIYVKQISKQDIKEIQYQRKKDTIFIYQEVDCIADSIPVHICSYTLPCPKQEYITLRINNQFSVPIHKSFLQNKGFVFPLIDFEKYGNLANDFIGTWRLTSKSLTYPIVYTFNKDGTWQIHQNDTVYLAGIYWPVYINNKWTGFHLDSQGKWEYYCVFYYDYRTTEDVQKYKHMRNVADGLSLDTWPYMTTTNNDGPFEIEGIRILKEEEIIMVHNPRSQWEFSPYFIRIK